MSSLPLTLCRTFFQDDFVQGIIVYQMILGQGEVKSLGNILYIACGFEVTENALLESIRCSSVIS